MLATSGALPRSDAGWAYELKWDGVRALVAVEGGRVTLTSRAGNDVTRSYPELRHLGEQVGTTQMLLDGEIVSFDEQGRPSFSLLQSRMHVTGAARARTLAAERTGHAACCSTCCTSTATRCSACRSRRAANCWSPSNSTARTGSTPPLLEGTGAEALAASRELQLEGIVAKRRDSPLRVRAPFPGWVKVKNVRTQDVVVGGWKPGRGGRVGQLGSLLVGVPDGDGLRYVGSVGTGLLPRRS